MRCFTKNKLSTLNHIVFRFLHREWAAFPLVEELGGTPPIPQNIGLSPNVPPLFCHKNADFVIFIQFLSILPKMSQTSPILMGKPD